MVQGMSYRGYGRVIMNFCGMGYKSFDSSGRFLLPVCFMVFLTV